MYNCGVRAHVQLLRQTLTLPPPPPSPPGQGIQEATEDGESLLSLACSAGYYELAEVLLRMRASVEDRGVKGQSHVHVYMYM